ncbi:MAG: hypothetical protein AAF074_13565, partial [Pseudomonadota bacterium]
MSEPEPRASPEAPTRSAALLAERERQGLRALSLMRVVFLAVFLASVWLIGANLFDKLMSTLLAGLAMAVAVLSLRRLARTGALRPIGLAGAGIDILFLAALPVIWYLSVGGAA